MTVVEMLIGAIVAVALLAVSLAHFMWAIGRNWPVRDEKLLAQTVVGFAGIERMPARYKSLGVALAMLAASVLALSVADHDSGGLWLDLIGLVLAAGFLARGAIGYTAWWAAITPEEPFRTLDRKNYSPLCLGIGVGFFLLVLMRFI